MDSDLFIEFENRYRPYTGSIWIQSILYIIYVYRVFV